MRKDLMMNGVGIMAIIDDKFYIEDEEWGCYKSCTEKEFIEELKKISYICLTSWNKEVRKEYLDFVDYTQETIKRVRL